MSCVVFVFVISFLVLANYLVPSWSCVVLSFQFLSCVVLSLLTLSYRVLSCLCKVFSYLNLIVDMPAKKRDTTIVVGTRVCRHTDGTCMAGMVTSIKTTTKGKDKASHTMYHVQFLDNEKLRCGPETMKEMQASYVSCRAKLAQTAAGVTKAAQLLYPEGFDVYTTWMPEMSALTNNCKAPSIRMDRFDSWLRKAKLLKFHAALNEYEIQYSCGYTRYVKISDMQQMVTASGEYKQSTSPIINKLVLFADAEFNGGNGRSIGKIARASETLRSKRESLVIPETPLCSQSDSHASDNNVGVQCSGTDCATSNNAARVAGEVDADAITQVEPKVQPELGVMLASTVDAHVSGQDVNVGASDAQPAADLPGTDCVTSNDAALVSGVVAADAKTQEVEQPKVQPELRVMYASTKDAHVSGEDVDGGASDAQPTAGLPGTCSATSNTAARVAGEVDGDAISQVEPKVQPALGVTLASTKDAHASGQEVDGGATHAQPASGLPGTDCATSNDAALDPGVVDGAASTTSEIAALVENNNADAKTLENHEPGTLKSQSTGNVPEEGSLVAQATLPIHDPKQQDTNSSTTDDDFETSDSQPCATPEYTEAGIESSPNTQHGNTSASESETAALPMSRDSHKEGKPTSEVDGNIRRPLQPPPSPAITGVPFPGWDHPELMEHFQQHLKSIGFDNPAMVKEFVEHKNAMLNSSGECKPLSGIKRKGPEKKTASSLKAKTAKTRRTKTKKSLNGDKELQIVDQKDVATNDESVSGIIYP